MTMTDQSVESVLAAARFLGFQPSGDPGAGAAMARESGADPLFAVARSCELVARHVVLPPDWFDNDGPPALVQARDGGEPFTIAYRRGWRLLPTGQPLSKERAAGLDRHAVELLPRLPDGPTTQRELLRRCLPGTGRDWVALVAATLIVAFGAFWTPILLGQVGSSVAGATGPGDAVGALLGLLLLAGALAFVRTIRVTAISRLRTRIVGRATAMLWVRAVHLPLAAYHRLAPVSSRVRRVQAPGRAGTELGDDVVVRVLDAVVVVAALAAVATTTPPLVLGVAAALLVETIILAAFVWGAGRRARETATLSRVAGSTLGDVLGLQTELRIWRANRRAAAAWWALLHQLTRTQHDQRVRVAGRQVVVAAWPIVVLTTVVLVSAASTVSFADFVTAQSAGLAAAMALGPTMAAADALLRAQALFGRSRSVVEQAPEQVGDPVPPTVGAVAVSGLTVSRSDRLEPRLRDVTLSVAPGEFVVLAGPVGAGTSTLLRSVLGLEPIDAGRVTVDGHDVTPNAPELRRRFGALVQQQGDLLLPGTIRENIAMGRSIHTHAIWRVLHELGAAPWVEQLGLGLETGTTNEGRTLSVTQRQQVLLARALVDDPALLVLDAPVAALWGPTLDRAREALLRRTVTRIVVTRHPSFAAAADRLVLFADGRVVAAGAPRDLIGTPDYAAVFGGSLMGAGTGTGDSPVADQGVERGDAGD